MNTNGSKATHSPKWAQMVKDAAYSAAIAGWYDTSEAAQHAGLLTVTMIDMANVAGSVLPAGATHHFFVTINATVSKVIRYPGPPPIYKVEAAEEETEPQRQEATLRAGTLDTALVYFTEGAYQPAGDDHEARHRAVDALLAEEESDQEEREEGDPVRHAVVRDELPDLYMPPEGGVASRVLRQWSVSIGSHYCEVGIVGYRDDHPLFRVLDAEPPEEGDEE